MYNHNLLVHQMIPRCVNTLYLKLRCVLLCIQLKLYIYIHIYTCIHVSVMNELDAAGTAKLIPFADCLQKEVLHRNLRAVLR